MNIKSSSLLVLAIASLIVAMPLLAQTHTDKHPEENEAAPALGKLVSVTEKESAWAAQARKTYPLNVCLTSDEALGSMGKSPEYIYRVEGKPDRLVIFCCNGCEEDFMKEPAKYLAKLDAAQSAKSNSKPKESEEHAHKGHH